MLYIHILSMKLKRCMKNWLYKAGTTIWIRSTKNSLKEAESNKIVNHLFSYFRLQGARIALGVVSCFLFLVFIFVAVVVVVVCWGALRE